MSDFDSRAVEHFCGLYNYLRYLAILEGKNNSAGWTNYCPEDASESKLQIASQKNKLIKTIPSPQISILRQNS